VSNQENINAQQSYNELDQAYQLGPVVTITGSPERKTLSSLFGILLAAKTIYPQANTDARKIELLTAVFQGILETLDEGGIEMDTEAYTATACGLSGIMGEAWSE